MKNEYPKICATCTHSGFLYPSDECFCDIKGPVSATGKCSKYYFDALKHKPAPVIIPSAEDI